MGADSGRWSARGAWSLPLVLLVALVVHWPALDLGFIGDDYEWWLAARMALEQPIRLVQPFGGLRPLNLWILAADHLLWGTDPRGYHLTSLLLHLGAGAVLWLAAARLGLPPLLRSLVALLWLCSPFSLEPAQSLCERFEPLLLVGWLGLVALWPGPEQTWTGRRLASAAALAVMTVLLKESWVVLPVLVLACELLLARRRPLAALSTAAGLALPVVLYVALYALDPPIPASYLGGGLAAASKVPHTWAAICGLTALDPSSAAFGWPELAALVTMLAAAIWAWRLRDAVVGLGLVLFLIPLLPVLTVPFLVTRYTANPLAGFLLVTAGLAARVTEPLPSALRFALRTAMAAVALLYFAWGLHLLAGDMVDSHRRDLAHRALVAEARAFAASLPRDRVLVAVRLEHSSANRRLLAQVAGVPKAYFERALHPYGLIRWVDLLSFVLEPVGGPLYQEVPAEQVDGRPFVVIGHRQGGFVMLPAATGSVATEVRAWADAGAGVSVLRPWPAGATRS